jgi:hypothetical protein
LYLFETHEGEKAKALAVQWKPSGDIGLKSPDAIEKTEVHVTNFKDPGPDYSIYKTYDASGALIQTWRRDGY